MFSTTSNYKLDFESINPKTEPIEKEKPAMISNKNKDYMQYFPRCKDSTKRSHSSRVTIIEAPSEKEAMKALFLFQDVVETETLVSIPREEAIKLI